MTKHDRFLVILALAPNALYVVGLIGAVVWRLSPGMTAVPNGMTPLVLGMACVLPIATTGLVTFLRLRGEMRSLRKPAGCGPGAQA